MQEKARNKDLNREIFQDHMPENICFGCGRHEQNAQGLNIESYWESDGEGAASVCYFQPQPHHQGWKGILNGGIIATLIDCHCMCTAMAAAYAQEGRPLSSQPTYRYATGSLQIKYLRPVLVADEVCLRATLVADGAVGRKVTLHCEVRAADELCAVADVVAVRVFNSDAIDPTSPFQ